MSETPMISRRKLDEILPQLVATCYGDDVHRADGTELTHKEKEEFADAVANRIAHELAKAAEYDEAMRRLNDIEGLHDEECPWRWWGGFDPEKGTDLDGKWYKRGEEPVCQCPVGKAERFVEAEIAANRFTP